MQRLLGNTEQSRDPSSPPLGGAPRLVSEADPEAPPVCFSLPNRQVVKSKISEWTDSSSGVPDFFSTNSSSGTAVRSGDEHDSDSEPETEGSPPAGKRKRGVEESGKNQTPGIGDSETQESDGILWTSSLDKKAKGPSGKSQNPSWKRLKHLHQEKVNGIRHKHKIYTHGSDVPDPVTSFEQLQEEYKIHPRIIHNIKEAGFQGPTPIQMQAIPVMLHVSALPWG
ncbi:putative ATP-dependent RNA helicase DDX52 [Acipenser ruthenus]|uniref:RNA helicase n=1 Tax=Acipenser ruthenus TaxID=7906 RepID=A0A444UVC8_ACIRT|nr:putative ATP-dependent RNA helicase DDX52 [Acipenser ruthenus]